MHVFLCFAVRGSDCDESGARLNSVHVHISSKSKHERPKQHIELPSPFGNVALAPSSIEYYKLRLREYDMDADFCRRMLVATIIKFSKACAGFNLQSFGRESCISVSIC
jgi:hypothetical protein